jgi:L-fucose isomerase-like protein
MFEKGALFRLSAPLPCLAFTRLRDEGITAPCEADVCALLTSMVLQEISRKPAC